MHPIMIISSQLVNLIEILYVLCIDYANNGAERRPDAETLQELKALGNSAVKQWGTDLPSLRDSINAAIAGRNKAQQLALLGAEIKDKFEEFRKNNRFTGQEIELLRALGAYLRTDSDVALSKIKKMAGVVNNPFISQRMAPEVGTQKGSSKALRKLVFDMVGRNDTALTIDEAKQVKELKPDLFKEYMMYRKAHNQVWKDAAVNYVRSSGHRTVPYEELLAYLHANGIDHMLPLGFTGEVDDFLRMYTNRGELIDGVPAAITFPSVEMNPNYGKGGGEHFVFQAIRSNGGQGPRYYTVDFKKAAARDKFQKVADFAPKVEGMRKRWFALVRKFNPEMVQSVSAVILEILYEFSARVGSVGNAAADKSTFGVSTLLVRHMSVDPSGNVVLRYRGKDGVPTAHKLNKTDAYQKFVIADLLQLAANKKPGDRLFTVLKPNGRFLPVGGGNVNGYFKSLGAGDVTIHKLRTLKGTSLFQTQVEELFNSGKLPKDEKRAMVVFNKMAEIVGKQLNHIKNGASGSKVTGTTALNSYISHDVQISYWRQLGFRIPRYLEKFDVGGSEEAL